MREIILNKKAFISSEHISVLKESSTGGLKTVMVAGLLLPKDEISRNGVLYDWKSINNHYSELVDKSMMYNHLIDTDMEPMGHFTDSKLFESRPVDPKWQKVWDATTQKNKGKEMPGWYYEASLNPDNKYAKSMIRGDLNTVSIQLMAEKAVEEVLDDRKYQRAFIGNILEASGVPVAGFEQTSVEVLVAEAFKMKEKCDVKEEEVNTSNADGAIQATQDLNKEETVDETEETDFKDEGLDKCPVCGGMNFSRLKSGQLQCGKCKRLLVEESFKEVISVDDIMSKLKASVLMAYFKITPSGNISRDNKIIRDKLSKLTPAQKKSLLFQFGITESFSENNSEGNNMSEEKEKTPPTDEQPPVEEQTPAEESKPEAEVPVEGAPKEEAKEEPKAEALKEQDDVSDEEKTKKEGESEEEPVKKGEDEEETPESTDEEPMKEEVSDMDKIATILDKLMTTQNAIMKKLGMTEEEAVDEDSEEVVEEAADKDSEEVVEEAADVEEDNKPVEEPSASETFNPGKLIFGESSKSEDAFKETIRKTLK